MATNEERLLILESANGDLYAIPEAVMAEYRLDDARRAELAAALDRGDVRGFGATIEERPVTAGRSSIIPSLVNPALIRGFNPQPDPPGRPGLGGPDTLPVVRGIIIYD